LRMCSADHDELSRGKALTAAPKYRRRSRLISSLIDISHRIG